MKKKNLPFSLFTGIISVLCLLFSACTQIIPSPIVDQLTSGSNTNARLVPPEGVKASHGGFQSVTLTWKLVEGATRYNIYSADSAFTKMTQIGETKDNSRTFVVSEPSGTSKYYCVAAVNYSKEVSSLSQKAFGSTLATPIITSIDNGADGTEATVNWWMDNCSESTYLNNTLYEVSCYSSDNLSTPFKTIQTDKDATSVKFTGLTGKTLYYYEVSAYTKSDNINKEISDKIDSETAHRLIPNPVDNFTAAKGINTDSIELTFDLPELVDYKIGQGGYEQHPVYFTIERKEMGQADKDYQKIVSYLGSMIPASVDFADEAENGKFYFSCKEGTAVSANITTDIASNDLPFNENYDNYITGSTIHFKDTNSISRTKLYTYRIKSYVDDSATEITAGTAVSEADGWLISEAKIKAVPEYFKDEETNKYYEIEIRFNINFDDHGLSDAYKYFLRETRTPFEDSVDQNNVDDTKEFKSLTDLSNYRRKFTDFTSTDGYYKYELFILDPAASSTTDAYISTSTQNQIMVTDDASKKIEIKNLTVTDGFAHKYIISWEMENIDKCEYSLSWRIDGENTDSDPVAIVPVFNGEKTAATYEINGIPSGDSRTFKLIAFNGLETEETTTIVKTLGQPAVTFNPDSISYSSITVSWPEVQNGSYYDEIAKKYVTLPVKYEVSAVYEGEESQLCKFFEAPTEEEKLLEGYSEISAPDDKGIVSCKINKPAGWDNPSVSGKPVIVSVKAISINRVEEVVSGEEIKASATTDKKACTLGPALINTKVTSKESQIDISWDKVTGAKYYLIYRTMYKDNKALDISGNTYYVVDTTLEPPVLTEMGGAKISRTASIAISGVNSFTLQDKHDPAEKDTDDYTYNINQTRLGWGLPFGYVVIPVLEDDDFTFESNTYNISDESEVEYGSLIPEIGSTSGYGLNLTASKAESDTSIKLTWDRPYLIKENVIPYVFRCIRYDYENEDDKEKSDWELVTETGLSYDATSYNDILTDSDKTRAYYYAVQYRRTKTADLSPSYSELLNTTYDKRYDDGIESEELNKGYLFYVGFDATHNAGDEFFTDTEAHKDYYSQKVSHTPWDFKERVRGPKEILIYGRNVNTTYPEILISKITCNSSTSDEEYTLNNNEGILIGDGGDTLLRRNGTSLILTPKGISEGTKQTTDGLLKILRSTKTTYVLSSSRSYKYKDGESISIIHKKETDAYRQITDTELAKCVGLIIADGIYKAGVPYQYSGDFIGQPKIDKTTKTAGETGSIEFTHTSWADYSEWYVNNYRAVFNNGCSTLYSSSYNCDFTLNANSTSGKAKGSKDSRFYYFAPLTLKVTHDKNLESYNCSVYFTAGAEGTSTSWKLQVNKIVDDESTNIANCSTEADVKSFFPYSIGGQYKNPITTADTSLPTYSSDWWN